MEGFDMKDKVWNTFIAPLTLPLHFPHPFYEIKINKQYFINNIFFNLLLYLWPDIFSNNMFYCWWKLSIIDK